MSKIHLTIDASVDFIRRNDAFSIDYQSFTVGLTYQLGQGTSSELTVLTARIIELETALNSLLRGIVERQLVTFAHQLARPISAKERKKFSVPSSLTAARMATSKAPASKEAFAGHSGPTETWEVFPYDFGGTQ